MSRSTLAAVCLLTLCGAVAQADVVVLKNGDRISGKIETMADGKLQMKSDAMGPVTMALAEVQTFSTDAPITLQFKDGTVVHQKVAAAEGGKVAVEAGGLVQPQNFPLADLAAVNPPEKPKATWKGIVTAGATVTTGNSETTTVGLDAMLMRRGEDDRVTLKGYYLYAENKDESTGVKSTTTDKWFVGGKYDFFITPKVYAFGNASYEKDRISHLDARAIGGAGLGYQWIESKALNFNTDAGFGGMHEAYTHPDRTNDTIVGQAGWHFDKSFTDHLIFLHDFRIFPDLEKFSNFTFRTSGELRATLTQAIFASFKVLADYNSNPAPNRKRLDVAYILGIGITF